MEREKANHSDLRHNLSDHLVMDEILSYRQRLCRLWNDENIFDCTPMAAALVLRYRVMQGVQLKNYQYGGRSLFFWHLEKKETLSLLIQETEEAETYQIEITPEGKLQIYGHFFESPKLLLNWMMLEKHHVYRQLEISSDTPLWAILHQNFDEKYAINYPPEFPPLLLEIALANKDYRVAAKILEHPFVNDPALPRVQNFRLTHLLNAAVIASIANNEEQFLDFLISEYALLDSIQDDYLNPLAVAVRLSNEKIVRHLLTLYPPEVLQDILEKILPLAAENASLEIFQCLFDSLPLNASLAKLGKEKTIPLFTALIRHFGPETFKKIAVRFDVEIDWEALIDALTAQRVDPRIYFPLIKVEGEGLINQNLKCKILLSALDIGSGGECISSILEQFAGMKTALGDALMAVLHDEKKSNILIASGCMPEERHFLETLKTFGLSQQSLQRFMLLLSAIQSLDAAKKILPIASAFGEQAVTAALTKFPELTQDREFLTQLLSQIWRGASVISSKAVADSVSLRASHAASKHVPISSSFEYKPGGTPMANEAFILPEKNVAVSTDILVDLFLPRGEIGKIQEILLQAKEGIWLFWWKCIFCGLDDLGADWDELASKTLVFIEEKERLDLLKNAFHYSAFPLAGLLLKHCGVLSPDFLLDCFRLTLEGSDFEMITFLEQRGELNLLNEQGESLLHLAVREGKSDFVAVLLEKGCASEVADSLGQTPYGIALDAQKVTICYLLKGKDCFEEIAKMLIQMGPEESGSWLFKAFLNSSSCDLFLLLDKLRQKVEKRSDHLSYIEMIDRLEFFIKGPGTMILRFPRAINQFEMRGYGPVYSSYEEQQLKWGLHCEDLYLKFYQDFQDKNFVMLEALMQFAAPQGENKGYGCWRLGSFTSSELVTHFFGRYFLFWGIAQKMFRSVMNRPNFYGDHLQKTKKGYRIFYKNEDQLLPLTEINVKKPFSHGVFKGKIIHTHANEIKQLLPILAKIFKEIKEAPREAEREGISLELKEKIALFFWLGCHLTMTERGSSQYMLMMHRFLYHIHGFQTSPWSSRYVQPDCIALVLPFDIFFKEFYDALFEYAPIPLP